MPELLPASLSVAERGRVSELVVVGVGPCDSHLPSSLLLSNLASRSGALNGRRTEPLKRIKSPQLVSCSFVLIGLTWH